MAERDWAAILDRAKVLASSNGQLTMRALYEALVAEGLLRPGRPDYVNLSNRTAQLRKAGKFPQLLSATSATLEEVHGGGR